ncbi:interferon gamma 1 isoform 2 precursor [Ictalurus punctatus]|uniref:Interferon gamma n=1 Tax=Ictalurus punctatus TaxID=7998 RepID=Q45NA6_ICTPU|nr:interferon gamma 1 isoform 2 precursor [Ictalurus punctatus]AAZ40506.1 interferon gamma 2b [Ictalurus punctatus]
MTLFWRICFVFFGMMAYSEAFLPKNIKESIDHLNNHYNPNPGKLYDGHSLFLDKLTKQKFEESEQKLLMTIILDAYNKIFTKMENETQDETLKNHLHEVKDQMNKLKEHYFSGKHADIKKYVTELLDLKENDPRIQSKAIFELKAVYNKATNLGRMSAENPRRRRQAKSSKKQHS